MGLQFLTITRDWQWESIKWHHSLPCSGRILAFVPQESTIILTDLPLSWMQSTVVNALLGSSANASEAFRNLGFAFWQWPHPICEKETRSLLCFANFASYLPFNVLSMQKKKQTYVQFNPSIMLVGSLFVLLTWCVEHDYDVLCLGQERFKVCTRQDL